MKALLPATCSLGCLLAVGSKIRTWKCFGVRGFGSITVLYKIAPYPLYKQAFVEDPNQLKILLISPSYQRTLERTP
jgi:hypothetical protein